MKTTLQNLLSLLMIVMLSAQVFAQTNYAVRFVMNSVDCQNMEVFIDLEVKANTGSPEYYIADQNYRFSFNKDAVANPSIVQELELSGNIFTQNYSAFFDAHHLNGSLDSVVTYNVVLTGGTGYPVNDATWVPVGRVKFDILDIDSCLDLIWHTHDPVDFPPTFISEKVGGASGVLLEVDEGLYDPGQSICFEPICKALPIEIESFTGKDSDCAVDLVWTTASETDNSHFVIQKYVDDRWRNISPNIAGAGTTNESQIYGFIDNAITDIFNYYRIMQVDLDGKVNFSDQIFVKSACYTDEISLGITELFPNPIFNQELMYIQFYTERDDTDATILITDALGRSVRSLQVGLNEGANKLSFRASDLASGTYFVQVRGENWYSTTKKFVKLTE